MRYTCVDEGDQLTLRFLLIIEDGLGNIDDLKHGFQSSILKILLSFNLNVFSTVFYLIILRL